MQPAHKYLSNLTPLRGIAALWVVVFHFSEIVVKFVSTDRSLLLTKGYLMVDLFFIMSGFIIYHVYQQSFLSGISGTSFRPFIVARFARVYPLHFFTLLLFVVILVPLAGWDPMFSNPRAIPTNLLLIHSFGIHKGFNWNVPSWSISAEWWAYMVFPFLAVFIYRKKRMAVSILALFVILAYLSIMFWIPRVNMFDPTTPHRQNLDVTFDYGFLRGLAGFISGMILYKLYEAGILTKLFQKDISAIIVMTTCIISMHFGWNDGFDIILFVGVVFAFAHNNGRLHILSNGRLPQYLGKISYSIYLMQLFPLIPLWGGLKLPGLVYKEDHSATSGFWTGAGYCLIYMTIVIGLASLTYYTIEKPCRKFFNRKWGKEKMPVYA
jgi:peptidoglycan/LPS O-acetylase OafA/YrhL